MRSFRSITLALLTLAFSLFVISCGKEARQAIQSKNLALGKNIAIACQSYESKNGHLPPTLSELVTSGEMSQSDLDSNRYRDPRSEAPLDWDYNAKLGEFGALLTSPVIVDKEMVIILRDGSGRITSMDDLAE